MCGRLVCVLEGHNLSVRCQYRDNAGNVSTLPGKFQLSLRLTIGKGIICIENKGQEVKNSAPIKMGGFSITSVAFNH